MRVTVTGLSGYFGAHLLDALLVENHEVAALVRSPAEAERLAARGVRTFPGDVLRPDTLPAALAGAEAVIHLVGIIREPRGLTFHDVHVTGTRNILDAARAAGIRRYIHMSALGTRPGAASRYHQTKFAAEQLVRDSGLAWTVFRPSVMFGPGDAFINQFVRFYANPLFVPVIGPGRALLQPVYVRDVARMFALSITTPAAENTLFEVGGPRAYSFNELLDAVAAHLHKKRLKLHIPVPVMRIVAAIGEKILSNPPVTRDQIVMLLEDNTCDPAPAARAFNVNLTTLEDGIKTYL